MNNSETRKNKKTHTGVSASKKKNGNTYYRSSLTFRGKHISLGSFETYELAHAAYLEGRRILSDITLTSSSYSDLSVLSFEKWIILLNFRDNHIYFGTPIYVSKKMFYYYLTPEKILKFDPDDLFYFSSHKIMCRGNHYFVADYGLQVSITSRYGIKPYAVEGRDYFFINGDSCDFRRENIKIKNIYHGVTAEEKNGKKIYTVKIHINGNYIVGRYENEYVAAIAYNKAIDVLKGNGIHKNFTPNYIDGFSPSKYAEIYSNVTISPKIKEIHFSE